MGLSSETRLSYYVVNIFSENGIYGGNPLGGVLTGNTLLEENK